MVIHSLSEDPLGIATLDHAFVYSLHTSVNIHSLPRPHFPSLM